MCVHKARLKLILCRQASGLCFCINTVPIDDDVPRSLWIELPKQGCGVLTGGLDYLDSRDNRCDCWRAVASNEKHRKQQTKAIHVPSLVDVGHATNRIPSAQARRSHSMPNVALPHPECVTERGGTGVAQEQATPECDLDPVPGHPEASPRKHSARYVRSTAAEPEQQTTPAPSTMPTLFVDVDLLPALDLARNPVLRTNQPL